MINREIEKPSSIIGEGFFVVNFIMKTTIVLHMAFIAYRI